MESQTYVEYTLTLIVKRAVRPADFDTSVESCAAWMQGNSAQRELEREVLRAVRVLDGDCDCEVMSSVIQEEPSR